MHRVAVTVVISVDIVLAVNAAIYRVSACPISGAGTVEGDVTDKCIVVTPTSEVGALGSLLPDAVLFRTMLYSASSFKSTASDPFV